MKNSKKLAFLIICSMLAFQRAYGEIDIKNQVCESNLSYLKNGSESSIRMSMQFTNGTGFILLKDKNETISEELELKFSYVVDKEGLSLRVVPTKKQCLILSDELKQDLIRCRSSDDELSLRLNKLGNSFRVSNELRVIGICVLRN